MSERKKKIKEKRESQEKPKQLHPKEIRPEPGIFYRKHKWESEDETKKP